MLFALGFFGCLHWDDLGRLTVNNNKQFHNGSWVFIARRGLSPCPIAVIKKFMKMGNSRLFHQILKTNKRMELREEPMSYSRANELIIQETAEGKD